MVPSQLDQRMKWLKILPFNHTNMRLYIPSHSIYVTLGTYAPYAHPHTPIGTIPTTCILSPTIIL